MVDVKRICGSFGVGVVADGDGETFADLGEFELRVDARLLC